MTHIKSIMTLYTVWCLPIVYPERGGKMQKLLKELWETIGDWMYELELRLPAVLTVTLLSAGTSLITSLLVQAAVKAMAAIAA